MEETLKTLVPILVPLCGILLVYCIFIGVDVMRHRLYIAKYDNYDREPSQEDLDFIETVQDKFIAIYEESGQYPLWYKLSPYLGLLFYIGCGVGAGYLFYLGYGVLLERSNTQFSDAIWFERFEFGIFIIPASLAILFAIGWLLYQFAKSSDRFSKYIATHTDMWGVSAEDVYYRNLDKIVHKLRARLISPHGDFNLDNFLQERNQFHQNVNIFGAVIFLGLAAFFLIFDLSYSRAVYTDRVVSSGGYFNLGKQSVYTPDLIQKANIHCQYRNEQMEAEYNVRVNGQGLANIPLMASNLEKMYTFDKALRHANIDIDPHIHSGGKKVTDIRYTQCVNEFAKTSLNMDKWLSVLHFNEALDIMAENRERLMSEGRKFQLRK